ncbi:MAG: SDR family NAD(P)-dependent oxidoreductase [Pseudomonadales bacterium]|nr:SDR family NAD(P)-dependent oxidoreductase [Pseudomonadales bacterium]
MSEFKNKVVVITGAGRGLGRSHALAFAAQGAKVIVNDSGGAVDGTGSGNTAQAVADEIAEGGGMAVSSTESIATEAGATRMIQEVVDQFGTVDIVVNNAGILRDKTFKNVTMDNFRAVLDVHLMGSVYVTKAAWPIMIDKGWGRVVFTSSGSGIFGNFGQSNYASAKMSVIGLMNVLKLEGHSKGVCVNTLAPGAITRMTEPLGDVGRVGKPEQVSPAVLYLCSEDAPTGLILQAANGRYSIIKICVTDGIDLGEDVDYQTFSANLNSLLQDDSLTPA